MRVKSSCQEKKLFSISAKQITFCVIAEKDQQQQKMLRTFFLFLFSSPISIIMEFILDLRLVSVAYYKERQYGYFLFEFLAWFSVSIFLCR